MVTSIVLKLLRARSCCSKVVWSPHARDGRPDRGVQAVAKAQTGRHLLLRLSRRCRLSAPEEDPRCPLSFCVACVLALVFADLVVAEYFVIVRRVPPVRKAFRSIRGSISGLILLPRRSSRGKRNIFSIFLLLSLVHMQHCLQSSKPTPIPMHSIQ